MKSYTFLIILIIICVGAGGCSLGPSSVLDPKRPPASIVSRRTSAEADRVQREQETLVDSLEKKAPRPLDVEPVMPRYDPLEDQIVSFSMVDEDLRLVLYSLAQSVGMNLILDPALGEEKRLITLNFRNVPASTVLKEILETYNLYYQVEKNVIRVRPFDERFYNLNFLDASVIMSFDMGGDVLGAGQTESAAGLAGTFKLSGKGANQGNAYDILETAIKRIISRQRKYSLNRLSGSLYVKDRPAVIRAVSRLVHQLKEVMSRQILIEAQIIEVSLSDAYSYGID
ncbi:MAG: pilus assembly protein MshL, partial [Deltaproteobacteria bacterium]